MKVLGLLLVLFSLGAHASEIKKTFDGTSARCTLSTDAGNSAYRLKILAERKEKSTRVLSLEISFLKCQENASGMALVPASGDEVLFQKTVLPNGELGLMEHRILSFSLTAFTESGKLLDKVLIEDLSSREVRTEIKIDESQLSVSDEVLINGLGVEAAKLTTQSDDQAVISEFISGTYKLK